MAYRYPVDFLNIAAWHIGILMDFLSVLYPKCLLRIHQKKEKVRRFEQEIEFIRSRWMKLLKQGDPFYNPNFSLKKCNYVLKP